jgi:CobQ-like glutamine amidotransferase family enzyme
MEDTIGIFDPNYYSMYTDRGNMMVANLVDRAREQNMTWPEVYKELVRLSELPNLGEATDTDVRESVFYKLGFHDQDVPFYC